MSERAILAEGLSKMYHIGRLKNLELTLQERIAQSVTAPIQRIKGLMEGRAAAAADADLRVPHRERQRPHVGHRHDVVHGAAEHLPEIPHVLEGHGEHFAGAGEPPP